MKAENGEVQEGVGIQRREEGEQYRETRGSEGRRREGGEEQTDPNREASNAGWICIVKWIRPTSGECDQRAFSWAERELMALLCCCASLLPRRDRGSPAVVATLRYAAAHHPLVPCTESSCTLPHNVSGDDCIQLP